MLVLGVASLDQDSAVALLDDNPRAGGQIWRQGPGLPPQAPLANLLAALKEQRTLTHWTSTRVIAPLDAQGLLLESAERGGICVTYGRLILATGARERLLPFEGWTLPGVTGAGALQALIKGGMPVRDERIVIAGSGPLLIAALATARAAGARVIAVVEQACAFDVARFGASLLLEPAKLRQALSMTRGFAGLNYWTGSVIRNVQGSGRVERVTIRRGNGNRDVTLDCDRVACGYGLVPNITLALALGCEIGETGGGRPGRWSRRCRRARWRRFAQRVERAFALQDAALTVPADDTLLCRCEDVSIGEVRACANWRDAKLHTRCGMGACQGRICGSAASLYFGWPAVIARPPFNPAQIGTLMMTPAADPTSAE